MKLKSALMEHCIKEPEEANIEINERLAWVLICIIDLDNAIIMDHQPNAKGPSVRPNSVPHSNTKDILKTKSKNVGPEIRESLVRLDLSLLFMIFVHELACKEHRRLNCPLKLKDVTRMVKMFGLSIVCMVEKIGFH